jgi:hypothetical protein
VGAAAAAEVSRTDMGIGTPAEAHISAIPMRTSVSSVLEDVCVDKQKSNNIY